MSQHTTDRELLELAARAIGLSVLAWLDHSDDLDPEVLGSAIIERDDVLAFWNPLNDDGDALQLAVKLDIEVFQGQEENGPAACAGYWGKPWRRDVSRLFIVETYTNPANDNSPYAATRRAIVLAAAEIGKAGGAA